MGWNSIVTNHLILPAHRTHAALLHSSMLYGFTVGTYRLENYRALAYLPVSAVTVGTSEVPQHTAFSRRKATTMRTTTENEGKKMPNDDGMR